MTKLTKRHRDFLWEVREAGKLRMKKPTAVSNALEAAGYLSTVAEATGDFFYEDRYLEVMVTLDGEEFLDQFEEAADDQS